MSFNRDFEKTQNTRESDRTDDMIPTTATYNTDYAEIKFLYDSLQSEKLITKDILKIFFDKDFHEKMNELNKFFYENGISMKSVTLSATTNSGVLQANENETRKSCLINLSK